MKKTIQKVFLKVDEIADYAVWALALASVFGSLYYSEIERLVPCDLCWWQRIFMYPIAIIMSVAILRKDRSAFWYVAPLSLLGMLLAGYQSLLQWGVISENVLDCSARSAVSCANPEVDYFGFITIPFLSFLSFTAINALLGLRWFLQRRSNS